MRPEKCTFAADEVKYLGFIISSDGVKTDSDKVKAIQKMAFPNSPKEMVRFLGAVNFYRDFISHFSQTASVLYKAAQSKSKFKSFRNNPVVVDAFEKLKKCLVPAPVLAYPDFSLPFIVQFDASGLALGAVIGHMSKERFRPIM